MKRILISLLLTVFLVACGAGRFYREGKTYQEQGKDYAAVTAYLTALDRRPGHGGARAAAQGLAQSAADKKLRQAEADEEAGRFLEALADYRDLQTLLKRLEHHFIESASVSVDVAAKIVSMEHAAADKEYRFGVKSMDTGDFSTAIAHFEAALSIKAGFRDAREQISRAYFSWAEQDVAAGHFRDGAGHYESSRQEGAASRAAEIYAALARYHVSRSDCRQGVRDYRAARELVPGVLEQPLAQAMACAEVRLDIEKLSASGPPRLAGVDVGEQISSWLEQDIGGATSEFVVLVTADNKPHFRVAGQVVRASISEPGADTRVRTTTGRVMGTCTENAADGSEVTTACEKDVELVYDEVEASKSVHLTVRVRVVQGKSREIVGTETFELSLGDEVRYATDFRRADDHAFVAISDDTDEGVEVDQVLLDLSKADRELRPHPDLVDDAIKQVAAMALPWVARLVDAEDPWEDPAELEIVGLE